MSKNNIFFDPTLNYWRCITEELPEKPKLMDYICYQKMYSYKFDNAMANYNSHIAELKRNALEVVNQEIIPTEDLQKYLGYEFYEWPGEIESKEVETVDDGGGCYVAGSEKVVFLTLPNLQSKEEKETQDELCPILSTNLIDLHSILVGHADEYKDEQEDFSKGKAEAYRFAAKKLKDIIDWNGLKKLNTF